MLHFFEHVFGLDSPNGNWYLFWSGFFGDVTIFAGGIALLRHKNCHEPRCWRLSHHPHKTCRRHASRG
jgi:hypothetical protein